jgi:hypothetical protein
MKKLFVLASIIITANIAYADLLHSDSYVSPERYAVNEADMQIDYSRIPPAPKLDLDKLDDMRFQAPNLVEKDFSIGEQKQEELTSPTEQVVKHKKSKKEKVVDDEAYKKKLSYKFAKWWVDKRYEREEVHHGSLHEIKVQKRLDYEKAQEEKLKENE